MQNINRYAIAGKWLSRLVLALVSLIFSMIAVRFLFHPVESCHELGIVLTNPAAITITRVSMGGIPLCVVLFLVGMLISKERLFLGLKMVFTLVLVLLVIRLLGLKTDGLTAYNIKLLKPELLILILSSVAMAFNYRNKNKTAQP